MSHRRKIDGKENGIVDILKFIMSLFVVAIHTDPFNNNNLYINPVIRVAVPFFFLISAYFYFERLNECENYGEKLNHLKKYCLRLILLYIGWMVILMPYILLLRSYFTEGFMYGIVRLARSFIFGSTFGASWYLMATIIATIIVTILVIHTSEKVRYLFSIFSAIVIVVTACISNYSLLFGNGMRLMKLNELYRLITNTDYYVSFPIAICFVWLGYLLSVKKAWIEHISSKICVCALAFFIGCAYLEQYEIVLWGGYTSGDYYFMTLPITLSIVLLCLKNSVSIKVGKTLRKSSVVIYCSHMGLIFILKRLFNCEGLLLYWGVLLIALSIFIFLDKLSKKEGFKIINYLM